MAGDVIEDRALLNRTWAKETLKRVLPAGLEPVGTKYDATWKQIHVLCTNGRSVVVPLAEMEAADAAPRIVLP